MPSSSYKSNRFFSHEFPLAISPQKRQKELALHAHDFMELVVVIAGRGLHYTQTEKYEIQRGSVFVIQPGHAHGFLETRSLHLVNILFDLSWFDRLTAEIPKKSAFYSLFQSNARYGKPFATSHLQLNAGQFKTIKSLLDNIQQQMVASKSDGNNLAATGLLLEIAGFLSMCYKGDAPKHSALLQIDAVMEYIEANHANELTLAQLADIARISTRNLLRLFRKATGTTPIDYLLHYRISRACRLLAETDHAVTKIAFNVGFTDGNYFCRQFKKIIRTSPARYRDMQAMLK